MTRYKESPLRTHSHLRVTCEKNLVVWDKQSSHFYSLDLEKIQRTIQIIKNQKNI